MGLYFVGLYGLRFALLIIISLLLFIRDIWVLNQWPLDKSLTLITQLDKTNMWQLFLSESLLRLPPKAVSLSYFW